MNFKEKVITYIKKGKAVINRLTELFHGLIKEITKRKSNQKKRNGENFRKNLAVQNDCWHISLRFPETSFLDGLDLAGFIDRIGTLGELRSVKTLFNDLSLEQMNPEHCYLGIELDLLSSSSLNVIENILKSSEHECIYRILSPNSGFSEYHAMFDQLPEDSYRMGNLLVEMGSLTKPELEAIRGFHSDADVTVPEYEAGDERAGKFNIPAINSLLRNRYFVKGVMIVLLLVIITSLAVKSGLFRSHDDEKSQERSREEKMADDPAIQTYRVVNKNVSDDIKTLGQIVFYEKINISSKVNGRLSSVNVQEGKRIRKGQLLAEVERLPLKITLAQQRSELEISRKAFELTRAKYENALKSIEIKLKTIRKAKADLNDKKVSYENMDRILQNKMVLFKEGGVSESEIKTLKAQHTTSFTKYQLAKSDYEIQQVGYRDEDIQAEGYAVPRSEAGKLKLIKKINTKIERAELESARSRIRQAENNIRSTKIMIQETYIKSPINGVVAAKSMEAGEMIKADSVIAVIMNISKVFIAMNINEKDIRSVKLGQNVEFTVDALGDRNFKGVISRITPVLDIKTRTIEVKADVGNDSEVLKPGMFARAVIRSGNTSRKLMVPVSALIKKEGNESNVYIVKKGLVFKQKIMFGEEHNDEIEVLKGLNENDVIISAGLNLVYPGLKIKPGKKGKSEIVNSAK